MCTSLLSLSVNKESHRGALWGLPQYVFVTLQLTLHSQMTECKIRFFFFLKTGICQIWTQLLTNMLLIPSDQVLWRRDSAIARPNPCPHYIQNMLKIKDMKGETMSKAGSQWNLLIFTKWRARLCAWMHKDIMNFILYRRCICTLNTFKVLVLASKYHTMIYWHTN